MVRYVILRRYLREIPTQISFRNTRISAWFTPRKGHLRGVKLLSPAASSPAPKSIQLDDDASTIASEESYLDFGVDEGNVDWQDDDDDPAESPGRAHSRNPTGNTSQPPSRPDTGHIKPGPPRPSDTCPHTCAVFSQNVNGLGGRRDDKLEKVIAYMIENDVGAYCLQETWQLCYFMLTIRGYTLFHHGMLEKPQKMGRTSAGVMIILNPEMTRAWARAGKLKPLTASMFPGCWP